MVAVTHRDDIAADLVVRAALRRGVDLFRFNTEDYPSGIRLVADPARPEEIRLLAGNVDVEIGMARGIWLRRPRWPVVDHVADGSARAFARQEAVAAIGGVWRLLASRCVSPADAMQAARWKVNQLNVAKQVGLHVPETLVTNDPAAAVAFAALGPTVAKAVAEARIDTAQETLGGEVFVLEGDLDPGAVRPTPVMFQRLVSKVADVRITAIGRRLFPVRVIPPPGAPVDVRQSNPAECQYEVADLDSSLAARLVRYLEAFGLRFGAFDLAQDAAGDMWFLECNPAGQWAWLEPSTGLPITETLLDLLLAPDHSE